ncbi:hypothetical protein GCM10009624_10620 [Gordonia sinesedis]
MTARRHGSLTMDRRRHDGPVALMAEILEGTADLRGAACTARPRLFDPDVEHSEVGHTSAADRWREVRRICQSCPARAACWAWATRAPHTRAPLGPTAASVNSPFRRVPDRATSAVGNVCEGMECDRPCFAMGLCNAHYSRYVRNPDQPRDRLLRPLAAQRRTYPDQEPAPAPPRSTAKRGARSRIKPSINRSRRHRR